MFMDPFLIFSRERNLITNLLDLVFSSTRYDQRLFTGRDEGQNLRNHNSNEKYRININSTQLRGIIFIDVILRANIFLTATDPFLQISTPPSIY